MRTFSQYFSYFSPRNVNRKQTVFYLCLLLLKTNLFHTIHVVTVAQSPRWKLSRPHREMRDDELLKNVSELLQTVPREAGEEGEQCHGLALRSKHKGETSCRPHGQGQWLLSTDGARGFNDHCRTPSLWWDVPCIQASTLASVAKSGPPESMGQGSMSLRDFSSHKQNHY